MMAALFLSLGVGVPAIAAGAKATGGSSSSSTFSTRPDGGAGQGAMNERSTENTQTQVEPTQSPGMNESQGMEGAASGSDTFSIDEGTDLQQRPAGAADRNQLNRLPQLDRQTIMDLQTALQAEGLYRGSVDGVAGEKTQQALRQYQQARQLEATGRLDEETQRQLGIYEDEVQPVGGADDEAAPGNQDMYNTSPDDARFQQGAEGAGSDGALERRGGSDVNPGVQGEGGDPAAGSSGSMNEGGSTTETEPALPMGTGVESGEEAGAETPGSDVDSDGRGRSEGGSDMDIEPIEKNTGSPTSPGGASAPVMVE